MKTGARGYHTPSPLTCNSTTSRGGAPKGNRNALKHGRYTKEMFALRREARMNLQKIKATMALLAARAAELPPVTVRVTRHAADLAPDERCSR
jgi:hypothetical protein